jgi:class 3 adenylate cyclase
MLGQVDVIGVTLDILLHTAYIIAYAIRKRLKRSSAMGGAERAMLEQAEAHVTRRTTVLFARVSGNEKPLAAAGMNCRARYVEALIQAAELSGGRVLRKQNDTVMAVFATSDAAAAAAARMHAYAECSASGPAKFAVRIGFHTGRVMQQDRDVLGDTVNLAFQFCTEAKHGQIVTSEETVSSLSSCVQSAARPLRSPRTNAAEGELSLRELAWRDSANQILGAQKSAALAMRHTKLQLRYQDRVLLRRRESDVVTLGRDPACDLVVTEQTASRQHCNVSRREANFSLRDHSTNGTFVMINGEGEVHVHRDEVILGKNGWIALGESGDASDDVIEYLCA